MAVVGFIRFFFFSSSTSSFFFSPCVIDPPPPRNERERKSVRCALAFYPSRQACPAPNTQTHTCRRTHKKVATGKGSIASREPFSNSRQQKKKRYKRGRKRRRRWVLAVSPFSGGTFFFFFFFYSPSPSFLLALSFKDRKVDSPILLFGPLVGKKKKKRKEEEEEEDEEEEEAPRWEVQQPSLKGTVS